LLRSLMGVFSKRDHLVDPSPLRRLIDRNLSFERLEETRLPCHVVATDLLEGIEVRIASGSVTQALLASAAIPGVFPPVRLDGRYLIDGGVANHTPVSAAVELGAKRVYVLPTGYSCTMETPPVRAIDVALHGLNILTVGKLVSAVQRFARDAEITVVPRSVRSRLRRSTSRHWRADRPGGAGNRELAREWGGAHGRRSAAPVPAALASR
jgi:NTE family protein